MPVAVVGAGVSGLSCAAALSEAPLEHKVEVYEADESHVGGRLRQTQTRAWPVELGAQFVHGTDGEASKGLLQALEKAGQKQVRSIPWPDACWSAEGGWRRAEADAALKGAESAMENLDGALSSASVAHALAAQSQATLAMASAVYANDYGTDLSRLGAAAVASELAAWESGEDYGVLTGEDARKTNANWSALVKSLSDSLTIKRGARLVRVSHWQEGDSQPLMLHFEDGQTVKAEVAVIALPLTVLREGDVVFDPPLPAWKTRAWCVMQMDNCLKVILTFDDAFWERSKHLHNMEWDVVCPGAFLPEIWFQSESGPLPAPAGPNRKAGVAVGFLGGSAADAVGSMAHDEVIRRSLDQLDLMFKTAHELAPASSHFRRPGVVFSWRHDAPHVRGGYSYPAIGDGTETRDAAGRRCGRLFFAGEHTHSSMNPCIQAAMDAGRRAAREILDLSAADAGTRSRL